MSEQERQKQIAETLALLGQMTPAALAANRDELFFRAGEASARGERRASSWKHRIAWPAAAAALALLASGLGAALAMHEPDVRVVYLERPAAVGVEQAITTAKRATPRDRRETDPAAEPHAPVYRANEIRRRPPGNGIIPTQDWAALSDAFAEQLRLQQERSQAANQAMPSASAENRGDDASRGVTPRKRARNYLELRDSMQAL